MIVNREKLEREILEFVDQDLLEEFAAFVASSIENSFNPRHESYTILQRICPDMRRENLEIIFEICRDRLVKLELAREQNSKKQEEELATKLGITEVQFMTYKAIIKASVVKGGDILDYEKLGITEEQYRLIEDFVKHQLKVRALASTKQLRPLSYEGIGLCGELSDQGFVVREVFLGSDAHAKGIKAGDIIVQVEEGGELKAVADPNLSDQEKVNLIRGLSGAQKYKVRQDGAEKIVELAKQLQNGPYRASESISLRIKMELAGRKAAILPKTPIANISSPIHAKSNQPHI